MKKSLKTNFKRDNQSTPEHEPLNPFRGLDSYDEITHKLFYGREKESKKLNHRVILNRLTVVCGKSGIGKTSILNAGLFPRLRKENYRPIRIRLNFAEEADPLKEQIRNFISEGLKSCDVDANEILLKSNSSGWSSDPIAIEETLWAYFRRVSHFKYTNGNKNQQEVTPVLVFDQFEEIFTLGKHHPERDRIIDELYWLLEDQIPPEIAARVKKDDSIAKKLVYSNIKPHFRVILSLREDYLPHLSGLKPRISSIDRNLFRVTQLNGIQAMEIITQPGGFENEQTVQKILHFFYPEEAKKPAAIPDEELEIEPAFLSLLCFQLFKKGKFDSVSQEDFKILIEDYYDSTTKKYPPAVHDFIEEKLLTEGGYRTPHYIDEAHPLREYIDEMEEKRILRKFHDGRKQYVEIIHDFLAPVIKERRLLKQNRKRRKKRNFIATFILLLVFGTLFSLYQWNSAEVQKRVSRFNQMIAETLSDLFKGNNNEAIRIAERAVKSSTGETRRQALRTLVEIAYSSSKRPFYISRIPLERDDIIRSAAYSANNQQILTAHEDGIARIYDIKGKCLVRFEKHKGRLLSAVFSSDEALILTASWDQTARLWSRDGKFLQEFRHDGPVLSAVLSPDTKYALTASSDRTVRLWDLKGTLLHEFQHQGRVISACFSPDGTRILSASWDYTAKLWSIDGRLLADLKGHTGTLASARFSYNGRYILTASWDQTIRLWGGNGELIKVFEQTSNILDSLFSPNDSYILAAGVDGTVTLYDLKRLELTALIKLDKSISAATFSLDSQSVLIGSEDGQVGLYDLQGVKQADFGQHQEKISSLAFSSNGSTVFTSSDSENAFIWELASEIVISFKPEISFADVRFSQDGRFIRLTASDRSQEIWSRDGKLLKSIKPKRAIPDAKSASRKSLYSPAIIDRLLMIFKPGESRPKCTGITPDFRHALFILNENEVGIWDSKKKVLTSLKHDRFVFTAVFSPDFRQVLTVSNDRTARLWDLQGHLIANINHGSAVQLGIFSPEGKRVLTVTRDNKVNIWLVPEEIMPWLKKTRIPQLSEP